MPSYTVQIQISRTIEELACKQIKTNTTLTVWGFIIYKLMKKTVNFHVNYACAGDMLQYFSRAYLTLNPPLKKIQVQNKNLWNASFRSIFVIMWDIHNLNGSFWCCLLTPHGSLMKLHTPKKVISVGFLKCLFCNCLVCLKLKCFSLS